MLLNVTIFIWYGAICPWESFATTEVVPLYRLIPLGLLILLLRRAPSILGLHKKIPQIEDIRQAIFMGFFGPIGCSAIFYLYVTVKFIRTLSPDGGATPRRDVENLEEAVNLIVWFLVVSSIVSCSMFSNYTQQLTVTKVVHGLSIPVGKLGFHLPRTISRSITIERTPIQPTDGK